MPPPSLSLLFSMPTGLTLSIPSPLHNLTLTSSLNASLSHIDLVAGVDSVYVTYSTLFVWSEMFSGFFREQLAIWHRQRRRWAVLAGQLVRLAKVIEDSESKVRVFVLLARIVFF